MMLKKITLMSVLGVMLFLSACMSGMPNNISPVTPFDSNQYLGKWYEIARLDHSFERGLDEVSAFYSLKSDGTINVLNSGYSYAKNRLKTAKGKAYFPNGTNQGYLKVSFFGPFYGSYVVFDLSEDKQQAFISGPNYQYLWFLSRTPTVSEQDKQRFIEQAKAKGFDTNRLIFPKHTPGFDPTLLN